MFDDYVEHSGSAQGRAAPVVDFQGFDNPTASEPFSQLTEGSLVHEVPIFQLGAVVFEDDIPDRIVSVAVSSDVLVVAFANNQFFVLELSQTRRIVKYEIPRKRTEFTLNKLFLDPTGRHLLLNSLQGETFYLFRGWNKPPKLLKKFSSYKLVIQSIAWCRYYLLSASPSLSTGEFLIGTQAGVVLEACLDAEDDFFKSQERFLKKVYSLPEAQAVTGLYFEYFPPSDPRKCLVLLASPSRLYQFVGLLERRSGDDVFSPIFTKYKDHAPVAFEPPGPNNIVSELCLRIPRASRSDSLPSSLAWLTDHGIYNGRLNFKTSSDDFIEDFECFAHADHNATTLASRMPKSLLITDFHLVMLRGDRAVALNALLGKPAFDDSIPLKPGERVLGVAVDSMASTYWLYTDLSLYELKIQDEDRDVWSAFLTKGDYESALRYAKDSWQRSQVHAMKANHHFDAGQYLQAAQSFAQSSLSFDEVALRFIDVDERDALRYYLVTRLERTRKTERTTRMMLGTWLLELYLSKYSQLEDAVSSGSLAQSAQDIKVELSLLEDELKQFLNTYKSDLQRETIYELIRSHGRTEILLHFATLIGDHHLVVQHWIHEEAWDRALDALKRQPDRELYYTYGPVLLRNCPSSTVDSWVRLPALDPLRLVAALSQSLQCGKDDTVIEHSLRYMKHIVFETGNTSPVLHNLLISLLVSLPQNAESFLLQLLAETALNPETGKPYYDLDYALRLCTLFDLVKPCILIYSKMGLWEESVDLALARGQFELAVATADMTGDQGPLRKKLWLKIAKFVVQERQDIKSAMLFLETADALKIEDILPLFPDFVMIDDFKEEICVALEDYSRHVDSLKNDMEEATRNAESIKADLGELRNRFITLGTSECCCHCEKDLYERQFYVFPCYHSIHVDCLINMVKRAQPQHILRRILAVQTAMTTRITNPDTKRSLLSANYVPNGRAVVNAAGSLGRGFFSAGDRLRDLIVPESLAAVIGSWSGSGSNLGRKLDRNDQSEEKLKEQLDGMLAASCPLCDEIAAKVDEAFLKEEERDGDWEV